MANKVHYKTSDGFVFYTENLAKNHARSLDDREVVEVPVEVNYSFKEPKPKEPGTKTKDPEDVDLNDFTVDELKAMAEEMEIDIPNRVKKAELIALIEDAEDKE